MSRHNWIRTLFAPRPRIARQPARRSRPTLEALEDRAVPAVLSLFTAGSSGFLNGARFEEVVLTSSTGTGVFNTFVQLQAGSGQDFDGNNNTEQGVNYDRSGNLGPAQNKQYDEGASGQHNRFLRLSDVPVVTVGVTDYYEFFLDVNQLNSSPFLSMDGLIVSVAGSGNLQQTLPNGSPFSYDPTFGGSARLVYNLDVGDDGDSSLRMVSFNGSGDYPAYTATDNGSGKGDVRVLIPKSLFDSAVAAGGYATPYVYLFSRFGYTAPVDVDGNVNTGINSGPDRGREEFYANDGFEEWSVKTPSNVNTPQLRIVKVTTFGTTEGDGLSIPEGSAIGWKYTVTNTGNVPLTSVAVTDSVAGVNPSYVSGDGGVIGTLEVGESWVFTASGVARSAHLGLYTNIGTATGTFNATTVNSTDPSSYTPTNVAPTIAIVKTVDANEDGTFADTESVSEGGVGDQKVDYKYVITNTSGGTDPVTVTSLADDRVGSLLAAFVAANMGSNVLAPGQSVTFLFNDWVVPAQNAGTTYVNTVTASGVDDESAPTNTATDTAAVSYANVAPAINVVKTAAPASVPEGSTGPVTYTYALTNASPAGAADPLTVTSLVDDNGTAGTGDDIPLVVGGVLQSGVTLVKSGGDQDGLLEVGETWTYTKALAVPPKNAGQSHTNVATAAGTDDEGNTATDTDTATVNYANVAPAINVVKTPNVTSVNVGGTVTYTYQVTNTSPAAAVDPLSNVALADTDGTPTLVAKNGGDQDNLLELGETWVYTLTVMMPQSGTVHQNTATATGMDDENTPAMDTDTATVTLTFTISGTKYFDTTGAGFGPNGVVDAGDTNLTALPGYVINLYRDDGDGVYDAGDTLSGTTMTAGNGSYSFANLTSGATYFVVEAAGAGFVQTAGGNNGNNYYKHVAAVSQNIGGDDFANFRVRNSGGRTIGFWGNKNGLGLITGANLAGLNTLNLRNADGTRFVLTQRDTTLSGSPTVPITLANLANLTAQELSSAKSALERWLQNADAVNMSYMLSAQYAAMYLNTTVDSNGAAAGTPTFVDPGALVFVPALFGWSGNGQNSALLTNLYSRGTWTTTGSIVLLSEVMANANALLGTNGVIASGDLLRPHAESLKIVLDGLNNNLMAIV